MFEDKDLAERAVLQTETVLHGGDEKGALGLHGDMEHAEHGNTTPDKV